MATPNLCIIQVLCNGELVGSARCCDFLEALQELTGQKGTVDLVVHALHGHSPEIIGELYEVLKVREVYFWVHDFFSLCSGYRLLRNEVSFCGAPHVESPGCSICVFGEGRQSHVKRMRTLFDRVPFVVVSPSEFTLDLWKNRSSLPYREALVHPHCTFEAFDDGLKSQSDESGRIRIAFLGFPIPHKGWPVFIDLASRLRKDPSFEFYHFGSEPQRQCNDVKFFSVAARRENRSAMTDAMLRNGIDVVLLWSICPETFSFTAYEALAAGALIITHENAGNIPFVIRKFDRGLVFSGESELWQAFEDGSIRDFVKRRKSQGVPCGALEYSRGTLDLLNWEAGKFL